MLQHWNKICLVLPKQKFGQKVNDKNLHSHMDSRGGVEHIDEDEAESDEKDDPGGNDIRRYEERDPAHDDKHAGREVNTEDEGAK